MTSEKKRMIIPYSGLAAAQNDDDDFPAARVKIIRLTPRKIRII